MTTKQNPYLRDDYPGHLTLEWLADNKLPIYVRNITRPRGQIAVHFVNNGRIKTEHLKKTYLPRCLSAKLGVDTILSSDDLRAVLEKGVVDLVRPDIAWQELQSEDAIDEISTMQYSEFSQKQTFVSKKVQDMEKEVEAAQSAAKSDNLEPLGIDITSLNPRILSLVERIRNNDISVKAALIELKTIEDELSETDCGYILNNGPERGQIRSWTIKTLSKITNRASQKDQKETAAATAMKDASILDDDDPEMTAEERAEEARREAIARQHQQV